jgi:hypothetical protein
MNNSFSTQNLINEHFFPLTKGDYLGHPFRGNEWEKMSDLQKANHLLRHAGNVKAQRTLFGTGSIPDTTHERLAEAHRELAMKFREVSRNLSSGAREWRASGPNDFEQKVGNATQKKADVAKALADLHEKAAQLHDIAKDKATDEAALEATRATVSGTRRYNQVPYGPR